MGRIQAASPPQSADMQALKQAQDSARRMNQVEFLGRVVALMTAAGGMQFDKNAPAVGLMKGTRQIVFIGEWPGLPDVRVLADAPCPDCSVKCDECEDGKRPCMLAGCAGSGINSIKRIPCPQCKGKRPTRRCKCKGMGDVVAGDKCKGCNGTKKMVCGLCFGTGRRGLGTLKASTLRDAPDCPTCHGQRRKFKSTPQPLAPHIGQVTQGMTVLLPVSRIILHIDGDSDTVQRIKSRAAATPSLVPLEVKADPSGYHLIVMLDGQTPGSRIYTAGGLVDV